jgi:hypothetical protein
MKLSSVACLDIEVLKKKPDRSAEHDQEQDYPSNGVAYSCSAAMGTCASLSADRFSAFRTGDHLVRGYPVCSEFPYSTDPNTNPQVSMPFDPPAALRS